MISDRAKAIKPSATLAISAKVRQLRANGKDVIDFGIGEPDFDTPDHIKEAAIEAIKSGFTKYTPPSGIQELKAVIKQKLKNDGCDYEISEIAVSCGAKQSLYSIMMAVLNPGDDVIVLSPYWVSYVEQIKLAGGMPVAVKPHETFHPNLELIEKAITKKARALIINSPNNPSGAVFSKDEIRGIADIAAKHNLLILSDEIYEKFIYGGKHYSPAQFAKERTIIINGVSKSYAMTGWRIGYCAGPSQVMSAIDSIQSHSANPDSIAQKAALAALKSKESKEMLEEFDRRRRYAYKRASKLFELSEPEGAFYIFPRIDGDSKEFAEMLLEKALVAVVPGEDFGSNGHIRISYATGMKNLEEGFDRIEKALES